MQHFFFRLGRLVLRHSKFCLVYVVIQMNGNSQYVEYMNNQIMEDKP